MHDSQLWRYACRMRTDAFFGRPALYLRGFIYQLQSKALSLYLMHEGLITMTYTFHFSSVFIVILLSLHH